MITYDDHPFPKLPWETIGPKLDELVVALPNLLERSWPKKWAPIPKAQPILLGITQLSVNTYRTIRFISAEKPPDPSRKLEYSISTPPLSRTILDGVFSTIYLIEDLAPRTASYYKSGWRELAEEHARYLAAYGSEPDWQSWLKTQASFLAYVETEAAVLASEKATPSSIRWWPIPSAILREPALSATNRTFLQFLYDWYYRDLSQASHLSLGGLLDRAGYFLTPLLPDRDRVLDKHRSDWFSVCLILLLCQMSELEIAGGFGRNQALRYVWSVLGSGFLSAKEIFDRRYSSAL